MKIRSTILSLALATTTLVALDLPSAIAATNVTATGTSPTVCNQTVGNPSNVTAVRLSGGDCVVSFKNVGTTTWSIPTGLTNVWALVIGGGGGGASRHAGGGGAGGVVDVTSYSVSGNISVTVGGGGSAGTSANKGTSGSDSRIFNTSEATAGSTGLIAKGGGFGDFYTMTSNNIIRAGSGGSGGGSGVPNPFTRDLVAGYSNADPRGLSIQSSQTQRLLNGTSFTSTMNQYGNDGAGGGNDGYWAGGGGGGAGAAGSRGGGAAGTSMVGGAGGIGITNSITGTSTYYAGGGGGGGGATGTPAATYAGGSGGAGGGGAGSQSNNTATAGSANTGGGGGGGGLNSAGTNGPGGAGGSGIVIVRYTPDAVSPTITGPSSSTGATSSISVAENSTAVHTFTASESVSWSTSGTDGSFFAITSGGVLSITSRNYESAADSDTNNTYVVTVTGTDSWNNATEQTLTVTITNVNEAPTITTNSSATTHSVTQAENISAVITYAASDVDAGTSLTWSIAGTDAADFSIAGSGALSFASNPDYEAPADSDANNSYIVVVTVSDGSLTDTQTVTITITNANENASVDAPTISGTVYKGVTSTITVTINVSGKVRFYVGGKRISNCKDQMTSGTYPNNSATCLWKPAVTGKQILTATLTPTDNTFAASTSAPTEVFVRKRATVR
jgi:hypothetical protein